MLLYLDDEHIPATRLAGAAGLRPVCVERHRFPDGELKLRIPPALPPKVVRMRSGCHWAASKSAARRTSWHSTSTPRPSLH